MTDVAYRVCRTALIACNHLSCWMGTAGGVMTYRVLFKYARMQATVLSTYVVSLNPLKAPTATNMSTAAGQARAFICK